MDDLIQAGEIYRHYKRGTTYRIVCLATLEATEKACVVYEALDPNSTHRFWIRPLQDFQAHVEHEGKTVKRFEKIH